MKQGGVGELEDLEGVCLEAYLAGDDNVRNYFSECIERGLYHYGHVL
jgi:hypothetical protein